MMPTVINELSGYENDAVMVNTMWDACHRNLYALVNSAAMNGVGKNTTVKVTELYLTPALQTVAVICGLIAHAVMTLWIRGSKKLKVTEEYLAYKK